MTRRICPHCRRTIIMKITNKERSKVLVLHKKGFSLREIERHIGVSFSSAGRIIKDSCKETSNAAE